MDSLFKKYRKRLICIGIFKSVALALALASISMGVVAIITLIAKTSVSVTLGLTIGIGAVVFIVASAIIYFKKFRPTLKTIAQKLDSLDFEERCITMLENQDNDSFMAKLQREDAKDKLSNVPAKKLKFNLALPVALILVFGIAFAAVTTTMSVLHAQNANSGTTAVNPPNSEEELFTVTYKVFEEGTGTIDGELTQKVKLGQLTQKVTAIPAEGYKFVAWVDEDMNYLANQNNPRFEVNVHENMTIFALFEKINQSDDEVDDSTEKEDNQGDPELNQGGENQPEEGDDTGDTQTGDGNSEGGSGASRENNNVIDGTKDYRENFDRERLEKELLDKDVPDDLKDILGDYYGTLKP